MKRAIMMNKRDTVATALEDLEKGELAHLVSSSQEVVSKITTRAGIPFGHKLAVTVMQKGADVVKYGEIIGYASRDIEPGDYVHVHNVESHRMQLPEVWYRE
jgi:altronate dehydratase small subunit